MFDEARHQIIKELRSAATLRVFLPLPDHLTWTEFRPLNQSELEVDNASASRAMRDLLNCGLVGRIGGGPAMRWKLSLKWGWRGNAAVRAAEQARLGGTPPPPLPALNVAEDILC